MSDISGDTKFNALLPIDELLCINFMSRLYRGVGYVGRALTKFYVFQVLWYLDENNCFIPVATLKAKNFGFFQENEKGVFTFQAGRVAWTRDKFTTTWKPDLYKKYEFRLGFNLRFFHFGIGYLYRDNSLLCSFNYPLKGPASYQVKNCTGFFTMNNGEKIHFLIEPAHPEIIPPCRNYYIYNYKSYRSPATTTPLFPHPEELSAMTSLEKEERFLLLILALKARIYSVYH